MTRFQRIIVVTVGVGVAGFFGLHPASAGDNFYRVDVAKHAGGPFKHEVSVSIAKGQTRTFYLRVKNKTPVATDLLDLVEDAFTEGYKAKYFFKGENITDQVVSPANYPLHVGGFKSKQIKMTVKRTQGAPNAGCFVQELESSDSEVSSAYEELNGGCPPG